MIDFMIIGLPRSGTAWAANWLTTEKTSCMHDPLYMHHYDELDKMHSSKTLGVSCTGLYNFPDFVNSHPSKKIILHRDVKEINDSMSFCGLPEIDTNEELKLNKIIGKHLHWTDLFERPNRIHRYLLNGDCDDERHSFLLELNVQSNFEKITINYQSGKRLMEEIRRI